MVSTSVSEMAKPRGRTLKNMVKKLQRRVLSLLTTSREEEVPGDVKEGHFAVHAMSGCTGLQRFVVELSYLSRPEFLKLLEQAEEEFGFEQEGVLVVPCRPDVLQKILQR